MKSFITLIITTLIVTIDLKNARAIELDIKNLGKIEGTVTSSEWTNRTIYSFYGIRFAKAPSGKRRFAPPELADPWNGVYNATVPGRECPALHKKNVSLYQDTTEDWEDCLFLNVFTPRLPRLHDTSQSLPVMVYLHGGGFYENSARAFPPNYLLEEDVILVVPQYRLGPLGFMSLQTDGIPGNLGLMDMTLSLEWVNKHIWGFGGNSSRVTVFGQSAGAASILLLLMSPMVDESLFQQAILQSGSGTSSWLEDDDPLDFATTYFEYLTSINETTSVDVMEEYFKNATIGELHIALSKLLAKDPFAKASKITIQNSNLKNKFIENYPADLLRIGRFRTLPMMTGVTRHDGSFIVTILYKIFEANNLLNNSFYMRNNLTRDVIQTFEIDDDNWALTDLLEEKFFSDLFREKEHITFLDVVPGLIDICGLLFFNSAVFRQAKINANRSPTFLYTFDYEGENTRFGYGEDTSEYPFNGGVHHSNDLLYLFPYHYQSLNGLNHEDRRMARIMVDLWTSFAKTGTPTSPEAVDWMPFVKGTSGPYLHINATLYMDDNFVKNEYKTF